MTYLVGYSSDRSGADALALAQLLVSGSDLSLAICTVVPETWGYPSPAQVDAEYGAFLRSHSQKTLDKARTTLGPSLNASFLMRAARSASVGLAQAAAELAAELIVLGSARDGPTMRSSLGSVASGVLALTDRPVILAPRGFQASGARSLQRVTCAFSEDGKEDRTLQTAIALSQRHGVPLRLVTFVVRDKQMYPTSVGFDAENVVANAWRSQAGEAQQRALAVMPTGLEASAIIGDGTDWRRAIAVIPWLDGEILVGGSHHMGTVSGLLFGTAFTRLLRYARVPIVAVP